MMKAVIDRFEGEFAVLLLGEGEQSVSVPKGQLPEGCKEGTWLQVELRGNELTSAVFDEAEAADREYRIEEKLAKLRRGGSPGR